MGLTVLAVTAALSAWAGRAELGGYLRVMTRPDLQGGDGKLGYWNLYGRLLNEGPYAALELRYAVLERQMGVRAPWSDLHVKVEGGSIGSADRDNGTLSDWRLSQLYVRAGNVLIPHVTWQIGTIEYYFGDLGLYDLRPAQLFDRTVGAWALYQRPSIEILIGGGDSGYGIKGSAYNTIFTPGGAIRLHLGDHLELGGGGQLQYEPAVKGNQNAPYITPGMDYEDWVRGEVVQNWLAEHPGQEIDFPKPVSTSALSWKIVGYLGFGGLGPVKWDNLFANYTRLHPEATSTETFDGTPYTLYVTALTDERYQVEVGNQMDLALVPNKLDAAWGVLYGDDTDLDNQIVPSDHDRVFGSTVVRLECYLTGTVHFLTESSLAREWSRNGNAYREHADSIFANTGGIPDTRGLEYGDTDTRNTWQGKAGFTLSPLGPGLWTRPTLRFLYGIQYSNQNNAFGNSFVETIDQYNTFGNVERHWHQLFALETEAWF